MFVHDDGYDAVRGKLVAAFERIRVCSPDDPRPGWAAWSRSARASGCSTTSRPGNGRRRRARLVRRAHDLRDRQCCKETLDMYTHVKSIVLAEEVPPPFFA
ncbi:hypothetical protein [Pseudonocardia sp. GCM10023141]|uniref:hypothetical protein n=1 Tax=Pseudonocardia sp. GCM10023141 TaxID=3252653 RepID=UPI003612E4F6